MQSNILELNDDKSIIMFIAKSNNLQPICDLKVNIRINNTPIPRVCVTQVLGVVIDDCLSRVPQANKITQNVVVYFGPCTLLYLRLVLKLRNC
jgi:hypothetical protein